MDFETPTTVESVSKPPSASEISESGNIPAKPFLKWVGGKKSVLHVLKSRAPLSCNRYIEPFVGGGALFFALKPEGAYLSDINFHLMMTYKAIQNQVDEVIPELENHEKRHCREYYLRARKKLSEEENEASIAALFIYLNKTCFNGLYRVNKTGYFNVPIGQYAKPTITDRKNLRAAHKALAKTTLAHRPFHRFTPQKNDFFYLDPPYHASYDQYSPDRFGAEEHRLLSEYCDAINNAGAAFLLSNSDTPLIRELYKEFTIESISAKRSVSCKSAQRGKTNELLIRNY